VLWFVTDLLLRRMLPWQPDALSEDTSR